LARSYPSSCRSRICCFCHAVEKGSLLRGTGPLPAGNARRWAPAGQPVRISGIPFGESVRPTGVWPERRCFGKAEIRYNESTVTAVRRRKTQKEQRNARWHGTGGPWSTNQPGAIGGGVNRRCRPPNPPFPLTTRHKTPCFTHIRRSQKKTKKSAPHRVTYSMC